MDSLSDFDSHSESSSSEDLEDIESLYGGQAHTIFSSLEETILKIDDFLLFERGFLHGDIVCLVSDPTRQMGKVVHVDMTVNLENIYGCKIQNVSSKDLHKIHSVSLGDYVVRGAWLGTVDKIVNHVTVLFDDGEKCELSTDGPEKIIALSPDLIEDPQYPFYPGQRVQIESSAASRSTRWLCGIRKDKHEQGTVCKVEAGIVCVDWLCCAIMNGENVPPPSRWQDSRNLSVLQCFPHANWQLGDWCVLSTEQCSTKQSDILFQSPDTSPNIQQIAVIVKTKTKVDVLWQDGSQSQGLDSHLLFPVNIVDAHDFWPNAFVLEKGTVDDSQVQRWGIVRSVDPKERTVKVKWCKSSLDQCDSKEEQIEEIVSAYELVEHPDFSYCLGEVVFRMTKSIIDLTNENSERNRTISKIYIGEEGDLKSVENGRDRAEFLDNKLLSCFGTVVGFENGGIEVKWATGATTKVAPYEIYRVDKCEGMTASLLSDENAQPPNEELTVKDALFGQKIKDVFGLNHDNAKDSSSHSISQVAIGVFTGITSGLFGSLGTSLIGGYKCTSEGAGKSPEEEALESCNLDLHGPVLAIDDLETSEKTTVLPKEINEDIMLPSSSKNPESFRQFDMVSDCSDHHFVKESGMELQSPQVKRSWMKKVHQEWSILEKDLPVLNDVFASNLHRKFNDNVTRRLLKLERMDLLRAAIVGTAGTPYHDGLFFFDIFLPPQYPSEPPMVYYNSGGLRLNPNLYESGKVCLSLLNTWTGSQSEVWSPECSTILQVLLSLQALVLNEKPYFNEAGYDTQIGKAEGEKNSVSYNENAFLVSCRSMLYLLRKPPKHFEELVDEHFRRRCGNILSACKAYMQGATVGHPFNSAKAEQETQKGSSTGFKIMLTKLYPKLVKEFSDKGINCSDLSD